MDNHDNRNKLPNMSWDLSSSMEEQAAAHHQYHHHYQLPAHHPHHQHQQQQQQQQLLHNQQQLLPFSPSAVWPNLFPLPFPSPSSSSTHVSFISSSSTHVSLPPPIPLNPYCFINPHQVQQKHDLQQQTSIKAVAGSAEDQVELVEQEEDQEQEDGEGEEDELEELGAMKEMMYKIAAMQPVDIDPATIRKPKRRNVRISDDPQSVAARHRRERISEKIRILQRLVPGGTKMDTASMLEEAVRYVKFLKREIRTLQQNNPPVSGTAAGGGDNNWQQQQGTVQLLGPSNTITTTIPSMEGRSSTNIIDQATSHEGQVVPLNISTFMINQG